MTTKPPSFEWLFACNAVLGGVAPGVRDTRFQDRTVRYRPVGDLGRGARWCSKRWLDDPRSDKSGPDIRAQGGMSRFAMRVGGSVTGGTVVVLPDDQVDAAAALAARLLRSGPSDTGGISEWSMALVRRPFGMIHLENEPVPTGLAQIAQAHRT